jgi:hypothetical protein
MADAVRPTTTRAIKLLMEDLIRIQRQERTSAMASKVPQHLRVPMWASRWASSTDAAVRSAGVILRRSDRQAHQGTIASSVCLMVAIITLKK